MSLLDIRIRNFGYDIPYLSDNVVCPSNEPLNELYEVHDENGRCIDDVAKYLNAKTDVSQKMLLERNLGNVFPPKGHGFKDDSFLDNMVPDNLTESQYEDIVEQSTELNDVKDG